MNNMGIYLLTTDVICQETETELSKDIATWGGDFERCVDGCRQCSGRGVDISYHNVGEVNREEIVSVGVTTVNTVGPMVKYNPTPATIIALAIRNDKNVEATEYDTRRIWHYPSSPRRDACVQVLFPTLWLCEEWPG
jgi:hypothetical protein